VDGGRFNGMQRFATLLAARDARAAAPPHRHAARCNALAGRGIHATLHLSATVCGALQKLASAAVRHTPNRIALHHFAALAPIAASGFETRGLQRFTTRWRAGRGALQQVAALRLDVGFRTKAEFEMRS
jgi:hypothetical protein